MPTGVYKHESSWNKKRNMSDYPQMGFQKGNKLGKLNKGKKRTKEERKKMSKIHKQIGSRPPLTPNGTAPWNKGKKCPQLGGKNSHLWKGGITPENIKIRHSIEARLWREAVFARDNWICQKCETKKSPFNPHHILNFAEHIELRFAIDNGITFCKKCHVRFHKIYGNKNNTREQLEKFLKVA